MWWQLAATTPSDVNKGQGSRSLGPRRGWRQPADSGRQGGQSGVGNLRVPWCGIEGSAV